MLLIITVFSAGCKKEHNTTPPPKDTSPEMAYTDLKDEEIQSNRGPFFLDINKDEYRDIFFGTQLVGDPINKIDKVQFLISSDILTSLPVNNNHRSAISKAGEKEIIAGQ